MNYLKNNLLYSPLAVIIIALLTFQSCDTTSADEEDDDHKDAWGVALFMGGNEIARQFGGEVTYTDGDHLELKVGEETSLINVRFLDEDGETFVPEDDDYSLVWEIEHQDVLDIEQHEEDGRWAFHFVGLNAGETHVIFQLWHLDHPDFVSLEFEVHVEQEVEGLRIEDENANPLVSVDSENTVTGHFNIEAGSSSEQLTIVFLDGEGNELEFDHDYEFEWHIEDSGVAAIEKVEGEEWTFVIYGHEAGGTEVHFELVKHHDDHNHNSSVQTMNNDQDDEIIVYESPYIDIIVNN